MGGSEKLHCLLRWHFCLCLGWCACPCCQMLLRGYMTVLQCTNLLWCCFERYDILWTSFYGKVPFFPLGYKGIYGFESCMMQNWHSKSSHAVLVGEIKEGNFSCAPVFHLWWLLMTALVLNGGEREQQMCWVQYNNKYW